MRNRTISFLLLLFISSNAIAQKRDSVVLKTGTGNIYGTLTTPKIPKGALPIAVIIPGSGPTDRDGNNGIMTNNSLRMLSDSLAKYGIASLRFDKRGIAASKAAADESRLLFTDYVSDVVAWVAKLRKDRRFNKIFIIGHSEGSLIGMLAAKKTPVAGYISIAGAGMPADSVIIGQLVAMQTVPAIVMDSTRQMFAQLRREGHVDSVPKGFYQTMFRSTVQRYLVSWMQYDPAKEIVGMNIPALIVQGTADVQVDTAQALLLAAAKPEAALLIIPGMNHIFKDASAEDKGANIATYYDPALPVKRELVQGIVRFIRSTIGKS